MRTLLLLVLLPTAWAYTLAEYTGGDVYVGAGSPVVLRLPLPKGEECLPVAVLWVRGGKDYPVVRVNGAEVVGGGMHRLKLEGNEVVIEIVSSAPAVIEGNSLVYCTKDPFVTFEYLPPSVIAVGSPAFLSAVIRNYGYSPAKVRVSWRYHPNVAPFWPPSDEYVVPARKRKSAYAFVSVTQYLVSAPIIESASSYPRVCAEYNDSISTVRVCDGPTPVELATSATFKCIDEVCYNTSNLKLEINGKVLAPGDGLSHRILAESNEHTLVRIDIGSRSPNRVFGQDLGFLVPSFFLTGLVIAAFIPAAFK